MTKNFKNTYIVKIIVCCMLLAMISCNNDNSLPNPELMCSDLIIDNDKEYLNDRLFTGSCYTVYAFEVPQIDEIRSYKKGIRHGVWAKYYHNGNLFYKSSAKNGVVHGLYTSYHDNGNLAEEGKMKMGSKDGLWKYYDISGPLYLEELYKNKMRIDEENF